MSAGRKHCSCEQNGPTVATYLPTRLVPWKNGTRPANKPLVIPRIPTQSIGETSRPFAAAVIGAGTFDVVGVGVAAEPETCDDVASLCYGDCW